MSRKTTKTARVLNLIAGGNVNAEELNNILQSEEAQPKSLNSEPILVEIHSETAHVEAKKIEQDTEAAKPDDPAQKVVQNPAESATDSITWSSAQPGENFSNNNAALTSEIASSPASPAITPTHAAAADEIQAIEDQIAPQNDAQISSTPIENQDLDDKDNNYVRKGQFHKFMSERMSNKSNNNPSSIVEILFNNHDPLSDAIRDQLHAEEAMTDAMRRSVSPMIDEQEKNDLMENKESVPFVSHNSKDGTMTIKTADGAESDELDYKFVNVFEEIVRSKVLDAMQKFDVCTCDRCIVDVVALTVTNLPAKCIVTDKDAVFPLLSYYSNKYATMVQTELVKACVRVKEVPHHKR